MRIFSKKWLTSESFSYRLYLYGDFLCGVVGLENKHELLPLERAASGDEEAYAVIAGRMVPIIRSLVQSFVTLGIDADDLEQEASLGLLAAVRSYRPEGGAVFTTYATTCIRNRLTSVARRHGARVRAEQPLAEESDLPAAVGSDPAEHMLEREALARLQEQLRQRLTDLEYRVLLARLSDLSYDEIAARLGVSKKAVDNAVQRLRRKMTAE